MRIFIDTNVLISAALNAEGIPFRAYVKAASYPNRGLICEEFAPLIFVLIYTGFIRVQGDSEKVNYLFAILDEF